jgi:hypothetical protein
LNLQKYIEDHRNTYGSGALDIASRTNPSIQTISLADYISGEANLYGKKSLGIKNLPPIKIAGLYLALAILGIIVLVMISIYIDFRSSSSINSENWKLFYEQYKNSDPSLIFQMYLGIQNESIDRATKLFSLIIGSTFLPVLTTILGYLFGTRQITSKSDDEEK